MSNIRNKKRYHPESHTAEHLLTQTMTRMFEGMIHVGSKVEKKKSKVDFKFTRNITKEEITGINKEMNELIQKNLSVSFEVMELEEAKKKGFDVSKVFNADNVRTVTIGGEDNYDSQPCSGEHVKSTKECGIFNLTTASFDNGILRVRFKVKKN